MVDENHSRKPWKKNLYENEDYDDNYTDPSFLKDLRTNLNVRFFTFKEAVLGCTKLNSQIACVVLFLIIFHLLYSDEVLPSTVLFWTGLSTSICYIFHRGRQLCDLGCIVEDSKTLLTVLVFGYLFAPLLHRLTDAISTDTIFSMTCLVLVLNLVFFDFGLSVAMGSKALSLNAAFFGAICLASRLSTAFHAFVLLVEAAVFFVLYPIVVSFYWHWCFLIPTCGLCIYLLFHISYTVLGIYILNTVFISFICPAIFVRYQQYKNNIHGPWDEAVVEENTESNIDENL